MFYSAIHAAEVKDKILNNLSGKISEFATYLLPGDGYTEVSIDLRENFSPDFSILGVREVAPMTDGTFFTQFSLFNTEADTGEGGDERIIGNLGFGARKLLNNNTLMVGLNNFYDYDLENEHQRGSLGAEVRSAVLEFNYNNYYKIKDGNESENVMEGWDYRLASQIPYIHWAKIFISSYEWYGQARQDVEGTKYGSDAMLTSSLNLELAYDDKEKASSKDEWYAKLQFIHPPRDNGPTAADGISSTMWKENKDMSDELLSKVERQNKIMIEFKGSTTISRAD